MKCLILIPILAVFSLLSGCTGYQLGSNLPESIQTIGLVVENDTEEPSIEVQMMKSLRAEVQADGRLKLRLPTEADVLLKVTLTHYYLSPLAYDRTHGTLAREYRVNISATTVLYDAETGEVLREQPNVIGNTDFNYNADLTAGKRSALSDATSDLARKVMSVVTTVW